MSAYDIYILDIPQMDVFTENYSTLLSVIEKASKKENGLAELQNSWEVVFSAYDHDPREVTEIPEIVNWIKKSLSAGIPWLYLLTHEKGKYGTLMMFVTICCGVPQEDNPGSYTVGADAFKQFIEQNYRNLEKFAEQYNLPADLVGETANAAINYILEILSGKQASDESDDRFDEITRNKQVEEGLKRLAFLEDVYRINPNIRKYFAEGKLYYSYITGGGLIGSIDTITYDKRYEQIVADFETRTHSVVYHAIEDKHTLALLFVSNIIADWEKEQPHKEGVLAWVYDFDKKESSEGYIKLDVLQGAFYRRDSIVYPHLEINAFDEGNRNETDYEVIKRLKVLLNQGICTDLDVFDLYIKNREICFSELQMIYDEPVGVIQRLSANAGYKNLLDQIVNQIPLIPYFFMVTSIKNIKKMAILFVSPDSQNWDLEEDLLNDKKPKAIVVDLNELTARVENIEYMFVNGGPVYLPE